jgi:Ca-activated chloride channel family protein
MTQQAMPSPAAEAANPYLLPLAPLHPPGEPLDRENYAHFDDNAVQRAVEQPVSTFSIDVDTGAYANVRRFLNGGRLPPEDAVRVEEMINYFDYAYPTPPDRDPPFSVTTELAATPWNPKTLLLQVGIKGYELSREALPAANLVFLVDVSGSMRAPHKLGLLKSALKLLSRDLRAADRIAIAVYAGAAGTVLEPTPGNQTAKIHAALDGLTAGGSTNGGAGIRLAYSLAQQSYIEDGINRVIIATDGDFNVGTVSFEALKDLVEIRRKSGIALTTLGFGGGNYNDRLMEQLADTGNGNYAYIDTLREARKVLVEERSSTLATIAKDVKIQIEFNPALVAEYRLIGYENRALRREDFNNDRVDAGEIGAGHTVTALYEIALRGSAGALTDPLRYAPQQPAINADSDEIAFLRLRYKRPDETTSRLLERPIARADVITDAGGTSDRFRFAAAVAAFGQQLRGGRYLGNFDYDAILELARKARGEDRFGYRGELLGLVAMAQSLEVPQRQAKR